MWPGARRDPLPHPSEAYLRLQNGVAARSESRSMADAVRRRAAVGLDHERIHAAAAEGAGAARPRVGLHAALALRCRLLDAAAAGTTRGDFLAAAGRRRRFHRRRLLLLRRRRRGGTGAIAVERHAARAGLEHAAVALRLVAGAAGERA